MRHAGYHTKHPHDACRDAQHLWRYQHLRHDLAPQILLFADP